MALLKFKRSAVSGKVPALADLELGELAINTFDGKLYLRKDNGTASIIEVGAGAGSGVLSFNTRTGNVTLSSGDVTGALGYTPYNSSNPAGYITGITSGNVTTALGYTPLNKAGDTMTGSLTMGSNWIYMSYNGGNSLRMNAYGSGFDFYNQSLGTWADLRARYGYINNVYDFDNSAYYLDPAGNSVFNSFNIGGGEVYFYGSATNAVGIRTGAGGAYKYFTFDASGNFNALNGSVTAGADIRAPIFYDSDDTGYYVNPNSTSYLNTLSARETVGSGTAASFVYIAPTLYYYWTKIANVSGGDASATILITSKYDTNYVNFASALLTISSWNSTNSSAKLEAISGCDVGMDVRIDNNNDVWLQVGSPWSSNLRWRVINKVGNPTVYYASPTQQTTTPANSTSISYGQTMRGTQGAMSSATVTNISNTVVGGLTARADLRSPIFYDSDDTAFYVSPNGGSRLNTLDINDTIYSNNWFRSYGNTGWYNQTYGGGIYMYDTTWVRVFNGKSFQSDGTIQAGSDMRAPIFYDSNNTAYYLNPADSSGSGNFAGNLLFPDTSNIGIRNATGDAFLWLDDGYGNLFIKNTNGGFYGDFTGYHFRSASSAYWAYLYASYFQHESSVRAPIFYDSNNTAYFVDPSSTAGNAAYFAGGIHISGANVTGNGLILADDGDIVDMNDGYCSMRFSLGVRIRNGNRTGDPAYELNSVYGASLLENQRGFVINGNYTDGRYSTRLRKWDDGGGIPLYVQQTTGTAGSWSNVASFGSSNSRYAFHVDGIIYTASDVRASQFVDANNTGYYVDPASTSVLNTVVSLGGLGAQADGTGNDPYGFISVTRGTGANYSYYGLTRAGQIGMGMGIDTSNQFWIGGTSAGYNATRTSAWFYLNTSGDVWANSSYRAPIFYDSNNTAYYTDPSGDTVLAGNLFIGQANNASYIYMGDSDNGQRVIHCNSDRVGFLTQGGGWGSFCHDDGWWQSDSSVRAPIFYDSNNTGYYVDPSSVSYLQTIAIETERTYLGSINNDYSSGYYHFSNTQDTPTGAYGHAHIIRLSADWNVQMFFPTSNTNEPMWLRRKQNGTYSAWRRLLQEDEWIGSKYLASDGRIYGTILYDSNDSSCYVDPSSTSWFKGNIYNWRQGPSNDTFGGLELREADGVANAQTAATYAPGINFHWSYVGAARFYYASNGSFVLAGQNDITNNRRSLFCNEIYASGNVTAYYSDERLKTRVGNIDNALSLVSRLSGFRYVNNDLAKSFGYGGDEVQIGVSAQEVQEVLPEVVKQAAFDVDIDKPEGGSKTGENYLTVDYSRLVPLLIEAIKELNNKVESLEAKLRSE